MNMPKRASRHHWRRWSRVFIESRHHCISGLSGEGARNADFADAAGSAPAPVDSDARAVPAAADPNPTAAATVAANIDRMTRLIAAFPTSRTTRAPTHPAPHRHY
jgi:hypothetical protein